MHPSALISCKIQRELDILLSNATNCMMSNHLHGGSLLLTCRLTERGLIYGKTHEIFYSRVLKIIMHVYV